MYIAILPKTISAILIASTAGAYQVGNNSLDHCVGNASGNVACLAYIQGAVDSWSSMRTVSGLPQCVPDGVSTHQLRDIVVSYLQSHPANRHEIAATLTIAAIAAAWNCK